MYVYIYIEVILAKLLRMAMKVRASLDVLSYLRVHTLRSCDQTDPLFKLVVFAHHSPQHHETVCFDVQ